MTRFGLGHGHLRRGVGPMLRNSCISKLPPNALLAQGQLSNASPAVASTKTAHGLQQVPSLFNDLIGAHKQCGRDGDPQGLRGLQIDCKFKHSRLFDREILGLFAQKKLVH